MWGHGPQSQNSSGLGKKLGLRPTLAFFRDLGPKNDGLEMDLGPKNDGLEMDLGLDLP